MTVQEYRIAKKSKPSGMQYAERAMLEQKSARVAYWRLNVDSSGGSDTCEELVLSSDARATPASVKWDRDSKSPARLICPKFDGSSSTIDLYSSALNTAMDWTTFTVAIWFKVGALGDWSDSTAGRILTIAADANNYLRLSKSDTNNQIDFAYAGQSTADSVAASVLVDGEAPVTWQHLAITVSDSANDNQLKAYLNGVQTGSTQTGIGVWSGAIDSDLCVLGSSALATPADQLAADSMVAELGIWSTVLDANEIKRLSEIS